MSQVAVSSYSFFPLVTSGEMHLADVPRAVRDAGADAVEFALGGRLSPPLDEALARTLRGACDRARVEIASVVVGADLLAGDESDRSRAADAACAQLGVAATVLGARRFRHDVALAPPGGDLSDHAFGEWLPIMADACRRIAERAHRLGVRSSVENHGRFVQLADRILRLIDAVDHPAFGVTLDLGNSLFAPQDHVEAAQKLAPHALTVHVKDFRLVPDDDDDAWPTYEGGPRVVPCPLGEGDVRLAPCIEALRSAGFDGPWVVEYEAPEPPPIEGVRRGVEVLRQLLTPEAGKKKPRPTDVGLGG